MGFVDRGGGREAKGSSLRRSKKNPGAASTRNKSSTKNYVTPATRATPSPPATLLPFLQHMIDEVVAAEGAASSPPPPVDRSPPPHQQQQQLIASVRQLIAESYPAAAHERNEGDAVTRLNLNVDAAVAILSRKLDADVEGILRRAAEEGHVSALLCWCNELERQPLLMETCRNHNKLTALPHGQVGGGGARAVGAGSAPGKKVRFAMDEAAGGDDPTKKDDSGSDGEASGEPGKKREKGKKQNSAVAASLVGGRPLPAKPSDVVLYCLVGVHVNNIDRTSRKVQEQWIEEVGKQGKSPEVLGILSGLNLARDSGTHYAQEWMLKECWRVAAELRLPLVLHIYAQKKAKEEPVSAATTAPAGGGTGGTDPSAPTTTTTTTGDGAVEEDVMVRTANRAAEIVQELLLQSASGTATAAPTAVVLYNGLKVLAVSPAMRELVRTHRPPATVQELLLNDVHHSASPGQDGQPPSGQPPSTAATAAQHQQQQQRHVPFYVLVTSEGLCRPPPEAPKNSDAGTSNGGDDAVTRKEASEETEEMDLTPLLPYLCGENREGGMDLSQLLVGTGAPWGTPQNIPDEHVRTLPNEPGNFWYVVRAVHDAVMACSDDKLLVVPGAAAALTDSDVAAVALRNFAWAFFSDYVREQAIKVIHGGAGENEPEAAEEEKRFASMGLRRSGATAAHVDAAAVPTAYVCVKCRAPLFYPSAVVPHRRGAGAASTAAAAASASPSGGKKGKGGGRKVRRGKGGKGSRGGGDDSGEDDDDDNNTNRESHAGEAPNNKKSGSSGAGEVCPSTSALFLRAAVEGLGSLVEDLLATHSGADMGVLAQHMDKIEGEHHSGSLAINSGGRGCDTATVACAACQAKLGEAQYDGPCYDCGAVLAGVTLRLRPRAVEECPILDSTAGADTTAAAASSASRGGAPVHSAARRKGKGKGDSGKMAEESSEDSDGDGDGGGDAAPGGEEGVTELDLILAAAAREREQLEQERLAEEEGGGGKDEDGGRRRREKKKNVKANNRSNFTHFRNKDFAPRLAKEKKLRHQRHIEGFAKSDSDAEHDGSDDSDVHHGSENDSSSSGSGNNSEAEVEAPAETMNTAATRRQRKKANKKRQQQQQHSQALEDTDDDDSD